MSSPRYRFHHGYRYKKPRKLSRKAKKERAAALWLMLFAAAVREADFGLDGRLDIRDTRTWRQVAVAFGLDWEEVEEKGVECGAALHGAVSR